MSEKCGSFSDRNFLLILSIKKHCFLEKLISKYIKVLVFSFFGDIHQKKIPKNKTKTFITNDFIKQVQNIYIMEKISKSTCNLVKDVL